MGKIEKWFNIGKVRVVLSINPEWNWFSGCTYSLPEVNFAGIQFWILHAGIGWESKIMKPCADGFYLWEDKLRRAKRGVV